MQNNITTMILFLLVLLPVGSTAQISEHAGASESANQPEKLEWLKDAGFGMFIHFSHDSQLGTVISHSLVGASDDYKDRFFNELPASFDPSEFDAYKIAMLAKLAGMKYVVLTTKHHSGFCLWDTKSTDFNIMNTPYGKDLLKEYVEGVRKAGLKVGFYYSPEDFWWLDQQGIEIRRRGIEFTSEQAAALDEYIELQCTELMTNYGQVDVGFVEELYHNTWERTAFIPIDGKGKFEIEVPGLEEGKSYQFKAIVKHPKLVVKGGIVKKTFSSLR